MKESLKKEYDALGLPIDRLPNIASNEQEEFFVLACNSHHALVDQVERLRELLKVAKCQNCDGSGTVAKQIRQREYVSRSMAMDAGDPSIEGSLYQEDEWDFEQCQWCAEVKQLLKETEQTK